MAYIDVPIQLQKSVSPEIQELYKFALENNFDEFTTLSQIRNKLREKQFHPSFNNFEEYSKKLNEFAFFDEKHYILKDTSYDIYDISNLLKQIKEEVLYYINPNTPKHFSGYILERQVSPPLEAFERVGNNKLNIKPSGRDYGLLFE